MQKQGSLAFSGLAPYTEQMLQLELDEPVERDAFTVQSQTPGCTAFIALFDGQSVEVIIENRTARTVSGVVSWETYEPEPVETIEE